MSNEEAQEVERQFVSASQNLHKVAIHLCDTFEMLYRPKTEKIGSQTMFENAFTSFYQAYSHFSNLYEEAYEYKLFNTFDIDNTSIHVSLYFADIIANDLPHNDPYETMNILIKTQKLGIDEFDYARNNNYSHIVEIFESIK